MPNSLKLQYKDLKCKILKENESVERLCLERLIPPNVVSKITDNVKKGIGEIIKEIMEQNLWKNTKVNCDNFFLFFLEFHHSFFDIFWFVNWKKKANPFCFETFWHHCSLNAETQGYPSKYIINQLYISKKKSIRIYWVFLIKCMTIRYGMNDLSL